MLILLVAIAALVAVNTFPKVAAYLAATSRRWTQAILFNPTLHLWCTLVARGRERRDNPYFHGFFFASLQAQGLGKGAAFSYFSKII